MLREIGEQWIEKAEDGKIHKMRLINGDCLQEMDKLIQEEWDILKSNIGEYFV